MTELNMFFVKNKKKIWLLGALCTGLMFFEILVFNQGFLMGKAFNLQERRYSISNASLYQFALKSGKLVALSNDPNITFDNINLRVYSITINCANSVPGAIGQIFYRSNNEPFTEAHSIRYDASLPKLSLALPLPVMVSSLRLDLTNTLHDKIACKDFSVNFRNSPILSTTRMLVYAGLLFIFILYIFRNERIFSFVKMKYGQEIVVFLIIEFFQFIVFKWIGVPLNDKFVVLKIAIITGVSLCLSFTLVYIDFKRLLYIDLDSSGNKFILPLFFVALIILTYFPVISSKYLFLDDYLNFNGRYQNIFAITLEIGRIGAGLYLDLLYKLTVETSFYGRAVGVAGIILIFFLFNKWMKDIGFGEKISLVLPFLFSMSLPLLNLGSYLTEFSFIWGGLFSALSMIMFMKSLEFFATKNSRDFTVHISVSIISILLSLFIYQATSTIGLALLVAYLIRRSNNNWQTLVRVAMYYVYFGTSAILYLYFNKLIWGIYHIPAYSRTILISNFPDAFEKSKWFLTVVLPQSIKQLLFAFGGNFTLTEGTPLAGMGYRNFTTGIILIFFVCAIVIVGGIYFLQSFMKGQKIFWHGLMLILLLSLSIPYSYFFLLVTKESSYWSFYTSGLVATMLIILGVCGDHILWHFIKTPQGMNRVFVFIIVPALILISLNNTSYLYTTWVRRNDFQYYYIKKVLQNSEMQSKRIHIIGGTGLVDIYWIKAAKLALYELGKSPDSYNISYSDNEYLVNDIEAKRFDLISHLLIPDERDFLSTHYIYNLSFKYYHLESSDLAEKDLQRLQTIFQKVDVIPTDEDHALVIDMRLIK